MGIALRGLYVPIITPLADDGSVAQKSLERLAQKLLDDGAAGLVALGTAGERMLLDEAERELVIETCAEVCHERGKQSIAGVGNASTRQTADALEVLSDRGSADAAICLVPYYVRPTQAGIEAHFEALAQATPLPIVIYNIPPRASVRASAEVLLELARLPTVIGVKQSAGPLDSDTLRLLAGAPSDFAVLSGEDAHLAGMTLHGGSGGIAATGHLATKHWAAMIDAGLDADAAETIRYHNALLPLAEAAFAEPSPTVLKGVLAEQGVIPTANVRLPLLPASHQSVRAALEVLARIEATLGAGQT